jgi:hypothetical protein
VAAKAIVSTKNKEYRAKAKNESRREKKLRNIEKR